MHTEETTYQLGTTEVQKPFFLQILFSRDQMQKKILNPELIA